MTTPQAILFDLDGVLYTGNTVIEGAIESLHAIKSSGLPCRFVTNTSTLSLRSLYQKLSGLGLPIEQHEIISAPQAALLFLQQQANPTCRLLLADDVKQDFAHLPQSDQHANFIIVGDIGNAWSYPLLNDLFTCLMQGAKLIAIHKNRFWQTEHGLQMDIGAFIHGLEYTTRSEAMIIGKPSKAFFEIAIATLPMAHKDVIMIGDDIDADIGGAQLAGLSGILVQTGKYRPAYVENSPIQPDAVIPSIANLPNWLAQR